MVGPDGDGALSEAELTEALAYLQAHPEIWEVVLTGGGSICLSVRRIEELTRRLAEYRASARATLAHAHAPRGGAGENYF